MAPRISTDKKEQKRKTIAEKSLESFRENGYHGTSMNMIAKYNGMSKGGLYAYFESKEDLFIYILDTILNKKDYYLKPIDKNKSAVEQLLEQWERVIFSWKNLDRLSTKLIFEFWLESSRTSEYKEKLVENYARTESYFLDIIKLGKESGEILPAVDAEVITQIFWSYIDGQVQFWIARNYQPSQSELENLYDQIKLLIRGILVK